MAATVVVLLIFRTLFVSSQIGIVTVSNITIRSFNNSHWKSIGTGMNSSLDIKFVLL